MYGMYSLRSTPHLVLARPASTGTSPESTAESVGNHHSLGLVDELVEAELAAVHVPAQRLRGRLDAVDGELRAGDARARGARGTTGSRTSTAVRAPSVVSVPCSMMRSGITMTSWFWADAVGRTSLSLFLHSNV